MRSRRVVTALVAVTAGLAASAAVRLVSRAAARRTSRPGTPAPALSAVPARPAAAQRDAVVLPFVRPVAVVPAPPAPATRARCGDNGGRTKAGAPCGSRATSGGRCHHHRVAA
jgi:hypothetical protein